MNLNLVPARTGALWVRQGVGTFFKQPLALAGLFFIVMALMSIASYVPFIGIPLGMILLPAATLGMMVATKEAAQGRFPMPTVLLTAFRSGPSKARVMGLLGLLYATGFLCAMGVSYLIDGGSFVSIYLGGSKPSPEVMMQGDFQAAMWVFMALHLPLSLLFWHAPALVHWHGMSPGKSLFFSLVACIRNFWAYVVFGLAWVALLISVLIVVTTLASLLGSPDVAGTLMFPLMLVLASMFFISLYFSFQGSFVLPEEASV